MRARRSSSSSPSAPLPAKGRCQSHALQRTHAAAHPRPRPPPRPRTRPWPASPPGPASTRSPRPQTPRPPSASRRHCATQHVSVRWGASRPPHPHSTPHARSAHNGVVLPGEKVQLEGLEVGGRGGGAQQVRQQVHLRGSARGRRFLRLRAGSEGVTRQPMHGGVRARTGSSAAGAVLLAAPVSAGAAAVAAGSRAATAAGGLCSAAGFFE